MVRCAYYSCIWFIFKNSTNAYSFALVSESESSHLRNGLEFLDGHWVLWGDSTFYLILGPRELRLQFGCLFTFIAKLGARENFLENNLLVESMAMHHASVSLGENWLVIKQLKDVHLGLEDFSNWHFIFSVANNETSLDKVIVSNINFDLNIFSWSGIENW